MSLNAARPIALLLRQLHIGIVDVLVNPVFGEFIFGHYRTIPRMPILELTLASAATFGPPLTPAPVVLIGDNGLTEAVLKEIDRALTSHGLIKVRAGGDDREAREAMLSEICDKLSCARYTTWARR